MVVIDEDADRDADKAEKRADAEAFYLFDGGYHNTRIETRRIKNDEYERQINAVGDKRSKINKRIIDRVDDKKTRTDTEHESCGIDEHQNEPYEERAGAVKILFVVVKKFVDRHNILSIL